MTVSEGDPRVRTGRASATLEELISADFVRVYPRCVPDTLVAAGLIARYCADQGIPFHVKPLYHGVESREEENMEDDDAMTVMFDALGGERPVCQRTYEALVDIGGSPDAEYTVAGIVAADYDPEQVSPELFAAIGSTKEPGIGIPTTDRVTGLAYSTLQHADYSGDPAATKAALEAFGISDSASASPKELASFAAVTSVTSTVSTAKSANGLERFLHPHRIDHPYQSIEGYSDIIQVLSQPSPGHVIALAFHEPDYEKIRESWQTHAQHAHNTVQSAAPTATDHFYRIEIDTEYGLVPTKLLSYHTTTPTVVAAHETTISIYTRDPPIPNGFESATAAVDGTSFSTHNTGIASIPPDTLDDFFQTFTDTYQ